MIRYNIYLDAIYQGHFESKYRLNLGDRINAHLFKVKVPTDGELLVTHIGNMTTSLKESVNKDVFEVECYSQDIEVARLD